MGGRSVSIKIIVALIPVVLIAYSAYKIERLSNELATSNLAIKTLTSEKEQTIDNLTLLSKSLEDCVASRTDLQETCVRNSKLVHKADVKTPSKQGVVDDNTRNKIIDILNEPIPSYSMQ